MVFGPHPYRARPARDDDGCARGAARVGDRDLLGVFAILALATAHRVARALAAREAFGAEATLAAVTLVVLVVALGRSFAAAARSDRT